MMTILTISEGYPYGGSNTLIFVKQLMDKFSNSGHKVIVISPKCFISYLFKKTKKKPYHYEFSKNENHTVYSPWYFSFPGLRFLRRFSNMLFRKSVNRVLRREKLSFDIVYSHFIEKSGTAAYKVSKNSNKPFFIASGESAYTFKKTKLIVESLENANGIIVVSNEMKQRLYSLHGELNDRKIIVLPNGVDHNLFYKKDKAEVRARLNINNSVFIVIFLGSFINRKGPLRLSDALKLIGDNNIKGIFIGGKGDEFPDYEHIIFKGSADHNTIVDLLNASDVFVLPTLNEGSCNAIIEAMACGLPIISSKNSFNDDILKNNYSLRIDPMSIDEIKKAIVKLYTDKQLRENMGINAQTASYKFDLEMRANKILNFIESKKS